LDICDNAIRSDVPSPDGAKRAVVFVRSCGATTPFSTQVSVVNRGEALPRSAGNVFVADGNHGAIADLNVIARWVSPNHLLIRYPAGARVFSKNEKANGVAVAYETVP
jgi:hypothetical protein